MFDTDQDMPPVETTADVALRCLDKSLLWLSSQWYDDAADWAGRAADAFGGQPVRRYADELAAGRRSRVGGDDSPLLVLYARARAHVLDAVERGAV